MDHNIKIQPPSLSDELISSRVMCDPEVNQCNW